MAGSSPHPRAAVPQASWPADLGHAAVLLAVSAGLYWLSFSLEGTAWWIPPLGMVDGDLFLAWVAVLVGVAAWPDLWDGLRNLRAREAGEPSPVVAWRAFLLGLGLFLAALVLLPLRTQAYASPDTLILTLYVSAFPFVAWTFVPLLAVHGILFGRVATYLVPTSRRLADAGAAVLFAVAAATTAVILQNPGGTIFERSWSAGGGILPVAACAGYVLIAAGLTRRALPAPAPTHGWGAAWNLRHL